MEHENQQNEDIKQYWFMCIYPGMMAKGSRCIHFKFTLPHLAEAGYI